MKHIHDVLAIAIVAVFTGCASTPVVLQPVGPCSASREASDPNGHLQVFSVMEAQSEGDDHVWYQHTGYVIYNAEGKRIKHVGNTVGKFDETPATVTLPAGRYMVKASAEGYRWHSVRVPVLVERGRTTMVHLESGWTPAAAPPGTEIVRASSGYAVGWFARGPSTSDNR